MQLRCKKGDMVVLIKSHAGNEGAIGTIVDFLGENPVYEGRRWCTGAGPCWLVRYAHPVKDSLGCVHQEMPSRDAWLQPIRGISKKTEETQKDRELSHA